jgi:plastocyanin
VPGDPDHPFAFSPAEVTVRAGTTVRWVNEQDVFHTVTSTDSPAPRRPNGLFNRSLFARGQTFEYTFRRAGTYHYYCQPHSEFMAGTVHVTG